MLCVRSKKFIDGFYMQSIISLLLGVVSAASAQSLENVTLQLKGSYQFQFAGYYAAKEKSFYSDVGFNVEILPHDLIVSPVTAVLNESADFGVADSSLVLHRSQGRPVVALGAIVQHRPLVLFTNLPENILDPYELKGRRVIYREYADDDALSAMFHLLDIENDINIPHTFDDDALISDDSDAISGYLTDQPFYYREQNLKVRMIDPFNFGVNFYGDILFTSEKNVRSNPFRAPVVAY